MVYLFFGLILAMSIIGQFMIDKKEIKITDIIAIMFLSTLWPFSLGFFYFSAKKRRL